MNKKLITLAVAAAMAAPAAAMAEATLYGKLNVSIDYADVDNAIAPTGVSEPVSFFTDGIDTVTDNGDGTFTWTGTADNGNPWTLTTTPDAVGQVDEVVYVDRNGNPISNNDGAKFTGWGVNGQGTYMPGEGRANRLGVKGSEDLGNGLKAIYQVEFGVNFAAADNNIPSGQNGGVSMRNSFVGLAGNWGTFLVGRHDTPLKISTGKLDLFADTMADYNGTVGFDDLRVDNAIAYISPSWSGFSLAGALVAPGGATAGSGLNINSDQLNGAWSLAAIYNNGPFYASAAYELLDNEMFMTQTTSIDGNCAADVLSCSFIEDDYTKWRFGLGLLDWNGFTLTAIYEEQQNLPGGQSRQAYATIDPDGNISIGSIEDIEEQRLWQVQAAYAFGNNQLKAMYGAVTRDGSKQFSATRDTLSLNSLTDDLEGDRSTWAVGFDHNFSKRTKAYVLYTDVDDDNNGLPGYAGVDWSGFSLGMMHAF